MEIFQRPPQQVQKITQGTRALWEFKAKHPLIPHLVAGPAYHVTNMPFGHLIIRHVVGWQTVVCQLFQQRLSSHQSIRDFHADKNLGCFTVTKTVVELGDITSTQ